MVSVARAKSNSGMNIWWNNIENGNVEDGVTKRQIRIVN